MNSVNSQLETRTTEWFDTTHVVAIGIDDYKDGIRLLNKAVTDAIKIAEIIEELKPTEQVKYYFSLASKSYSSSKIQQRRIKFEGKDYLCDRDSFKKLLKDLKQNVGKKDRLILYFAGHGVALPFKRLNRDNSNSKSGQIVLDDKPQGYLLFQDAKNGNKETYLKMDELIALLEEIPCRHGLIMLDCCFAGAVEWSFYRRIQRQIGEDVIPVTPSVLDRYITKNAWQIITSSSENQATNETFSIEKQLKISDRGTGENSPFVTAFSEAIIDGKADLSEPKKGFIHTTRLIDYLREQIESKSAESILNGDLKLQTPCLFPFPLKHEQTAEFVFLLNGQKLDEIKDNLPQDPKIEQKDNPYRGLLSYRSPFEKDSNSQKFADDYKRFFGRENAIDKLYQQLKDRPNEFPLTVVLGASGSGKSSLVKAGLIPKMFPDEIQKYEQQIKENKKLVDKQQLNINPPWKIFRPGQKPANKLEQICHELENSIIKGTKKLLVIDQLEEIVTQCQDERQKEEFWQKLIEILTNKEENTNVVVTLRSDFETILRSQFESALNKHLPSKKYYDYWSDVRSIVSQMEREELEEIIEKSASTKAVFFEDKKDEKSRTIVQKLSGEVTGMPGALPLISVALESIYKNFAKRYSNSFNTSEFAKREITWEDYKSLGTNGVIGSITKSADEVYNKLVKENNAYEGTIRNVMLRMISLQNGELARRQVLKLELIYKEPEENNRVREVVGDFVEARLFVKDNNSEGKEYVEPAHDALITEWTKITHWLEEKEEKVNLPLQRELNSAANRWESKKNAQSLWNSDSRIDLLKKLLGKKHNWFNKIETEFVQRSIGRKTFNSRLRRFTAISVFVSLSVLTIAALDEAKKARREEIYTYREAAEANLRSGNELEAALDVLIAQQKQREPLGLFFNVIPFELEEAKKPLLKGTMHNVLYQIKERNRLPINRGTVYQMAVNPQDNNQIVLTDENKLILWDIKNNRQLDIIATKGFIDTVAFSPDGQKIATGGRDKTVRLWTIEAQNLQSSENENISVGQEIYSLAFLNDKYLAIAGAENQIAIHEIQNTPNLSNVPKFEIPTEEDYIWSLAYSEEKELFAIAGGDGRVGLCQYSIDNIDNKEQTNKPGHCENSVTYLKHENEGNEGVETVTFTSKNQLAIGTEEGKIQIWDITVTEEKGIEYQLADTQIRENLENLDTVYSLIWFEDGKLATIGSNDIISIWEQEVLKDSESNQVQETTSETNEDSELKPFKTIQPLEVNTRNNNIAISPDDKLLATGNEDGTVKIWNTKSGKQTRRIDTFQGSITAITFSPDGNQILTAGEDSQEIIFWNSDTGNFDNEVGTTQQGIVSITFNPKNPNEWASITRDGMYIFWENKNKGVPGNFPIDDKKVTNAIFTPDTEKLITLYEDGDVESWDDPKKWNTLLSDDKIKITTLTLSPDGSIIAFGDVNGTVWEWRNGYNESQLLLETKQGRLNALAYTPDGQKLATVGEDNTVKLWSVKGKMPTEPATNIEDSSIDNFVFTNENELSIATDNGTVRLLNLSEPSSEPRAAFNNSKYQFAVSYDREWIAIIGENNKIKIIKNLELSETLEQDKIDFPEESIAEGILTNVTFAPKSNLLAALEKKDNNEYLAKVWEFDEDGKLEELQNDLIPEDLKNLLADSSDNLVSLAFNAENELVIVVANNDSEGSNEAEASVYNNDNKGSNEAEASVYRITPKNDTENTENLLDSFPTGQNKITSMTLSQDGETLVTGGKDGFVRIGNTSGSHFGQIQTLQGEITKIIFSPDKKLIATIGKKESKTTLGLWHIQNNKWLVPLRPLLPNITNAAFSPSGDSPSGDSPSSELLATLSNENKISYWLMGDEEKLIGEICSLMQYYLRNGSNLTDEERTLCDDVDYQAPGRISDLIAFLGDYYRRVDEQADRDYLNNFNNILDKSKTNTKKAEAYINKGVIHIRQEDYQSAIDSFNEAIYLDRNNVDAYINRGIAHSLSQNQNQAIADYDRAIALDRNNADAYISRGIAYLGLGNHDTAIADYNRAIAISPNNADAYYAKGFTLVWQQESEQKQSKQEAIKQEAINAYQQAEKLYRELKKLDYVKSAQKRIDELE